MSDIPAGDAQDNDYVSRTGQSEIPVVKDDAAIEAGPYEGGADSDEQLGTSSMSTHCHDYIC